MKNINPIKKVLLFYNPTKENAVSVSEKVSEILKRNNAEFLVTTDNEKARSYCMSRPDAVIVLGGDGTMLDAASFASEYDIPMTGINIGTLGYMYEAEKDDIDILEKLFTGEYEIESRMMLSSTVKRNGETVFCVESLNETVICRGAVAKLIDFELFEKKRSICSYRSDGIILSTPTGSTAYSMSAGGPVVDPSLDLILVSAVCPHGIHGAKSMVFSPDSEISVKVSSKYNGDIFLTADGNKRCEVFYNDVVTVKKSNRVTKLIKLKNSSFYEIHSKKFI